MSNIMPAESGDTNPDQLYPVTEAAELLLHGTGLRYRYTSADAKRALRAAVAANQVPARRIDSRLAFAYGDLDMATTIDAFMTHLKAGESRG